jgi:hypothetical protein
VTIACTRTIYQEQQQQQQKPNPPSLVNPPQNPIPTSVSQSTHFATATASIVIFSEYRSLTGGVHLRACTGKSRRGFRLRNMA